MKSIPIALAILLFNLNSFSQIVYTPNTYYVIPPTSGCNGVWAVQNLPGTCNGSYLINPVGCASIGSAVQDTLFLTLCSIPCEFITVNSVGTVCATCSVSYLTGIDQTEAEKTTVYSSPSSKSISIEIPDFKNAEFILTDVTGKIILQQSLNDSSTSVPVASLSQGIYFWRLDRNYTAIASGKILIE